MERIARAMEIARQGTPAPVAAPGVQYSRTRSIAVSPDVLAARHISAGHERSALAEAFKRLRTQILQRMRGRGQNALGVSSPRAGAGKTTVALNLAVHAAMEADWTVLLVDADVRRPGLCAALGVEPLPGLAEYLANDEPLERLLVHPGFGRCVLLPAGAPLANPSELLGSARMGALAAELKRRYPDRLVIFDLPALLDSADGIAVLPWVEALLLVVEEGRSAAEDVLRAAKLAGGERLLGTVLNKSRS